MKNLQYYRKTHYGMDHRYLADPNMAHAVAALTGKRTVTPDHLAALESIGFTVEEVLPPKEVSSVYKSY